MDNSDKRLAGMIDHTILKSNATDADVERVCLETVRHGFAAAVVPPCFVRAAADLVEDRGPSVCSVVGFPFGWERIAEKMYEAETLINAGATEIDAVMNVGAFLSGDFDAVANEAMSLRGLIAERAVFKLIIETAYLDEDGIRRAASIGAEARADFIKTSTGFAPRGGTPEDVRIIASVVGRDVGIKAAGGIRTRAQADELVAAGATRLGCSSSLDLFEG
jgi:deoxyribose-phosphate aldolase